jgi:hypothetical protein
MSKPKHWVTLPPNFTLLTDCLIDEAAAYRRCSRWEIFKKIREGDIVAFKDGRVTKCVVSSLIADRERAFSSARRPTRPSAPPTQPAVAEPTTKKRPGRPAKHVLEAAE